MFSYFITVYEYSSVCSEVETRWQVGKLTDSVSTSCSQRSSWLSTDDLLTIEQTSALVITGKLLIWLVEKELTNDLFIDRLAIPLTRGVNVNKLLSLKSDIWFLPSFEQEEECDRTKRCSMTGEYYNEWLRYE